MKNYIILGILALLIPFTGCQEDDAKDGTLNVVTTIGMIADIYHELRCKPKISDIESPNAASSDGVVMDDEMYCFLRDLIFKFLPICIGNSYQPHF